MIACLGHPLKPPRPCHGDPSWVSQGGWRVAGEGTFLLLRSASLSRALIINSYHLFPATTTSQTTGHPLRPSHPTPPDKLSMASSSSSSCSSRSSSSRGQRGMSCAVNLPPSLFSQIPYKHTHHPPPPTQPSSSPSSPPSSSSSSCSHRCRWRKASDGP